ncbi:MAG: TonB-dependent receptor [Kofleriaceae bacterium]|nr:MAG: TonB-dependent receptor [Kofleriaceae bacterium]
MSLRTNGLLAAALVAMAGTAHAQEAGPIDIEVPTVVTESTGGTDGPSGPDDELDLANVVQSAAKGVTTVQEAPVIVTVITADEIADRQFQTIDQILDTVPGYMRAGLIHSQFPSVGVRGTVQAVQLLHDSVSMFDPYLNVATFQRLQPLETIKRIETITGPGGVLWGANSFLGVVNIITKDAEDVDGVEVGGQLGDGNGDRANARVYLMAGMPDLMKGKAKLFVHSAFESYLGPGFQMPLHMFSAPLPQPNSPMFYGPLTTAQPARSYLFNFFAKFTIGKLQLRVQAPYAERHAPLGFPGFVARNDLPEDAVCANAGVPEFDPSDQCLDSGRRARDNQINFLDRYVVAEYKSRTAGGKAGINLKAYGIQFVRAFPQLGILSPIPTLLEGGLSFKFDATSYRFGGAFDGDFELPGKLRVNYGAEAFKEIAQEDVARSIQGGGIEANFIGPYDPHALPLPCPREPFENEMGVRAVRIIEGCPLTFAFPSDRIVGGAYVNPQWRPSKKLILDAGARLQVSPESLGTQSYPLTSLFSGTAVWGFIPGWHLKLNYAEGFRPPVYNNVSSNGEAVQLDGRPDLKVETSQAAQAEVNARIFKGERRIRELSFRLDYSYTKLENLIQIVQGRYDNTADRATHGGEALAKLYIQGGHRFELAYSYLQVATRDKGLHKSWPNHMFHLAGIFNVIDDKLTMFSDLRVVGAIEDPNRLVEHRDTRYGDMPIPGTVINGLGQAFPHRVNPTDLVLDRLPPAADLSLGFTLTPVQKLSIRGTVFNAFNARYYQPDAFYDYEPRLEMLPNPWEDWRAYISATYTH